MSRPSNQLTHFAPGSVREVMTISWPIMLTIMSGNIMHVVDRIMLSWYSLEAMNSVSLVSSIVAIFQFAPIALTGISEVFVGQYNGAKRFHDIGQPVWQMIWLSLGLAPIYIPIGLWGHSLFVQDAYATYGRPFFQITMAGAFIMPMIMAVCGFYSGLGKVKILTITSLIANLINGFLGYALIFGWGPFPLMGPKGAAYATVVAQSLNLVCLLSIFLQKKNRRDYHSHDYRFRFSLFKECLRIGSPASLSHFIEFSGWSLMINQVAKVNVDYLTVSTVSTSLFVMFNFLVEGLKTAVVSIASNMIGSRQIKLIQKLLKSAVKFHMGVSLGVAALLILLADPLIGLFVHDSVTFVHLGTQIRWSLFFVWMYLAVDGLSWVMASILLAAGDTKFILKINAISIWLMACLPTYIFVLVLGGPPCLLWGVAVPYALFNLGFFITRYRGGIWKTLKIR